MWKPITDSTGDVSERNAKGRPLDSMIRQAIANKRPKPHQGHTDTNNNNNNNSSMDIDGSGEKRRATPMHPDDILKEMVRSGNYTQDQVVEFCMQLNIPLSRMLRLDLMRNTKGNNGSKPN